MKKTARLFTAPFLIVMTVLPGSPHSAQADDEVAKGRELAERLCATCHLGPGQGDKKAQGEIPGFYAIARRPNQTEQGIMDWLRSVPPMMPNHHLSQDEMVSLSQFIMSLRDGGQP